MHLEKCTTRAINTYENDIKNEYDTWVHDNINFKEYQQICRTAMLNYQRIKCIR